MAKAKGTMTVTLPDGRQMAVPKGLSGDRLQSFVQAKLEEEQAQAVLAEAKRVEEVSALERTQVELSQTQALLAEQAKVISELQEQNAKLQQVDASGAASAMALMAATRDAERLRRELLSDLGAASEWRSAFSEDIREVAAEVRKKNAVIDQDVADRKRRNKILFDDIRESQGMPRQQPELMEGD